jgi:putative oxidoreductase
MPDLQLHVVDDRPPLIVRALRAVLPIPFGLLFVYIGWTKFDAQSMWVQIFDRIGLGQWFRYFTGAMQIAGGLLLILPRTRVAGGAMIACTMLGAAVADLFVLNDGPLAIVPVVLCGIAATFAGQAWIARS